MDQPKYSLLEIERRWRVDLSVLEDLSLGNPIEIEDLYIEGTRLRLRRMGGTYKLCKKYGATEPGIEPITNIYLTDTEYQTFKALPGHRVKKQRYRIAGGSLDVYESLAIFEIEFASAEEAAAYLPPAFVAEEVTGQEEFSGASLAARHI